MNTEKLINIQHPTHHLSTNDENSYIPKYLLKNTGRTGGKVKPQDKNSTRLQELSLMNDTYFGAVTYDNHLHMKLDYTIGRIFQEMSLPELEILKELERTQILQSLALAVLKIIYEDIYYQEMDRILLNTRKHTMILHLYQKSITIICF